MNQALATGVDAPARSAAAIETPTLLAVAEGAMMIDGFAFIGEVRTHLTTILGFAEMLADPAIDLTDKTRAEYGRIVATSGALLAERIERRDAELRMAS